MRVPGPRSRDLSYGRKFRNCVTLQGELLCPRRDEACHPPGGLPVHAGGGYRRLVSLLARAYRFVASRAEPARPVDLAGALAAVGGSLAFVAPGFPGPICGPGSRCWANLP